MEISQCSSRPSSTSSSLSRRRTTETSSFDSPRSTTSKSDYSSTSPQHSPTSSMLDPFRSSRATASQTKGTGVIVGGRHKGTGRQHKARDTGHKGGGRRGGKDRGPGMQAPALHRHHAHLHSDRASGEKAAGGGAFDLSRFVYTVDDLSSS